MGTEMAQTRYPTLNILDCIWVNANLIPDSGPSTSYADATLVRKIVAGTDPVAIDYWAAKHILYVLSPDNFVNPDYIGQVAYGNSFGDWLRLSRDEMTRAGYQVTVDESKMSIHITQIK